MTVQNFEQLAASLHTYAVNDYHATPQYRLLQEKIAQMHENCISMFTADEREFAEECFALLQDVREAQEQYVFRHGLSDCVGLLQCLGIL